MLFFFFFDLAHTFKKQVFNLVFSGNRYQPVRRHTVYYKTSREKRPEILGKNSIRYIIQLLG